MQRELTSGRLLDASGALSQAGWSTRLIRAYDRADIRAPQWRIKEWDYYLIDDGENALCLTIDDNSYMGMLSATLLNRQTPCERTKSIILPFTRGKVGLSGTSARGDVELHSGKSWIRFRNDGKTRLLECHMEKFEGGAPLDASVKLTDVPRDSMVIATPFAGKKTAFYYNQKIVGMTEEGFARAGGCEIRFSPDRAQGLLDWGRGVWTYDNTWYWSAAMGEISGARFGFNLGYGFGDTSAASENMLFVNGRAHKLSRVEFEIPQKDGRDDFLKPWRFTSDDRRFESAFVPQIDRSAKTSLGVLMSDQHQVFGLFTGRCRLDDGTEMRFSDLPGFAEKVRNKW